MSITVVTRDSDVIRVSSIGLGINVIPLAYQDITDGSAGYTVLSGAVDGDNTTFTLSQGGFTKLKVYYIGQCLSGKQYTADPATGIIEITGFVPKLSSYLIADYY